MQWRRRVVKVGIIGEALARPEGPQPDARRAEVGAGLSLPIS